MKFLKLFIVLCLFLVFATSESRADITANPPESSVIELDMYEGEGQWFTVPNGLTQATISGRMEHGRFSVVMDDEEVYAIEGDNEEPGFTFPVLPGSRVVLSCNVTMGCFVGEIVLTKGTSLGEIPHFNALLDGNGNIILSWAAPSAPVNEYIVYKMWGSDWIIMATYPASQTSALVTAYRSGINKFRLVARNNMAYSDIIYAEVDTVTALEPEPSLIPLDMGYNWFFVDAFTTMYLVVPDGCNYAHIAIDGGGGELYFYLNDEMVFEDQDISVSLGDKIIIDNSYGMLEGMITITCF